MSSQLAHSQQIAMSEEEAEMEEQDIEMTGSGSRRGGGRSGPDGPVANNGDVVFSLEDDEEEEEIEDAVEAV